ncbi:MAG: restriction endonuclease [Bacteroidales bacterium]|nr:restriction endonuclease [Bacteroidales bacterium]
MDSYVFEAVNLVQTGRPSFFKFIAANETGDTGGHQCGFYIPREFAELAFGEPCVRGRNKDLRTRISWNDAKITESRFVYYGVGTRNESRITQFGRGFEFLRSEYTGALVVFTQIARDSYRAFVFNSEDEINEFLGALGLSPADANKLIRLDGRSPEVQEEQAFADFIRSLTEDFPSSDVMSAAARKIEDSIYDHEEYIQTRPDDKLISWSEIEYRLFRAIENDRYAPFVNTGFSSVDDFIEKANMVLNRRKSRAGKSLEHHLGAIFSGNGIEFEGQVVTEGNKKPDFIFPSSAAYHDTAYPIENLVFLAAKTTCKDRWRQILNEADRFRGRTKYLCTLQQGMTQKQMNEMAAEEVVLVVPKPYVKTYPVHTSMRIITLADFITFVKRIQSRRGCS